MENEKSYLKGLGFCAHGADSNSSVVDVKNGRIVRIRPLHFDWKYDPQSFHPWKMEARGKTFEPTLRSLIPAYSLGYKKRVYSPNRVLYPLKRVDWDPEGERHPENRGKSKYTRISWDEALDVIVAELKRINREYGPYAVLSQSDGHGETKVVHGPHGCQNPLLELLGGFTLQTRNPDSWEGWYWGAKHVWGCEPVGQMQPVINAMPDIAKNSEMILFWGCDPETTPGAFDGQMASRLCYWFTELGIRSVYICPDLNYGAAIHADKWIPIRPNTDAALFLGIAYLWMTQGTYDKEYVATHTYGYDKFEEYVVGKEDGVAKTPKWAAEITGVPERIIKALAREWAAKRTTIAHCNGGPGVRGPYSSERGRLEVLLLAMQGLGKPGVHQVKMFEWGLRSEKGSNPMPLSTLIPQVSFVYQGRVYATSEQWAEQVKKDSESHKLTGNVIPKQFIPKNLIHDAILNPPISWYGTTLARSPLEDQFTRYTYPVEGCSEVHMIWTDSPCWITCWNDSNSFIKALRSPKIEFMLAQHPWLENDCLFADIILPVNTKLEEEDIAGDNMGGQYRILLNEKQCIEPVGESKSDYEIACMIAERMGLLKEFTHGRTVKDWIKMGFEKSGVQGMISHEEFEEKGYFVTPTDPEWEKYPAGLRMFYEDPDNNPLKTPSGKIEFCSQNLEKYFPDDKERPPVPHYVEKGVSHDEALSSQRAKDYPLLILSNHGRWRVHANHDDIAWLREIATCKVKGPDGYFYEPLWIHPNDAQARGIRNGDVIRVYNERGAVMGGAYVTERIMPGVVYMDHGARYDPIIPGELDRGGAINTITPHNTTSKNATGMVCSGFLVEVAGVDLEEMRNNYPDVFNMPYDSAYGQVFTRVLDH
ncbi:MAG: molybdopterin-dependent oxidoreductase [Dehalococcoidales bacterium]|nr:molybdopterin-dependent oxidoreductase [Dehalococcoidales bacterium]